MEYREFLEVLWLFELRYGKDGIRHVGDVQYDQTTNKFRLGLIVPDGQWKNSAEWEAADLGMSIEIQEKRQ